MNRSTATISKHTKQNKERKNMFKNHSKTLILSSLLLAGQASAFVTVGTDNACDYQAGATSIQSLLDAGENNIRITNQETFYESIQFSQSGHIIGGFDNCTAASNGVYSNEKSRINGDQLGPVIKVNSPNDDSDQYVYLKGLVLTGGVNQGFHAGGGVSVYDLSDNFIQVTIEDSLISNNTGNRGGGLSISGTSVRANLFNTIILNNRVLGAAGGSALGGGVYCNKGEFILNRNSGISGNTAYSQIQNAGMGGGLYATGGCEVKLNSGTVGGVLDFRGVSYNVASSHGGGVYLRNGAKATADSQVYGAPININNNIADSNSTGFGDGGGIYVEGDDASFHAMGLKLNDNEAENGGGAKATDGALLFLYNNGACWNNQQCNEISGNDTHANTGKGGAIYLDQGFADLGYARATGNKSVAGSVVYAHNGSNFAMKRTIANDNGDDSLWATESTYHFVSSNFTMTHVTSANNQAQAATIRQTNGAHHISNSVFQEPLTNQFGNLINASGSKDCLLVDNNYGIGNQVSNVLIGDALLSETHHLTDGSDAIDRCFDIHGVPSNQQLDIDGEMAPHDHPDYGNGGALIDMGADEWLPSDVIFKNTFED